MTRPTSTSRALVVGTRGSPLALTQTESVVAMLRALDPDLEVHIQRITTKGDVMRDVPLATLGGRGVFVDAIEESLRAGEIDIAVHSAKDMPSRVPSDLAIGAFLERADARDVLVSRAGPLAALPTHARVGTSSLRRASQVRRVRSDLDIRDLRGNVDTRLRKLDGGDYDAIVLAGAGLSRLGLEGRVTEWLSVDVMVPSPGQGALAVETRADDAHVRALVSRLEHAPTAAAVVAERAFLARLGLGCAAAVGAYATRGADDRLTLTSMIGTPDGRAVRATRTGEPGQRAELGEALADALLESGGRALVAECTREIPA